MQVLLVDDDAVNRVIMSRLIMRLGYDVHTVADGREAISVLEREPDRTSLVLTDVNMRPDCSGRDVAFAARERLPAGVKVVAVTGDSGSEDAKAGGEDGLFDAVLLKPVLIADLLPFLQASATVPR